MTSTLRWARTLAMAGALALYADVASPQAAAEPQVHDHDQADAAPSEDGAAGMTATTDVMARIAALDARIKMLATDMNMFTGELKVETMAALLTALVERNSVMGDHMRRMHDGMMRRMMGHGSPQAAPPDAPAVAPDEEPGSTCAP